jgi:hypothetical protein
MENKTNEIEKVDAQVEGNAGETFDGGVKTFNAICNAL